MSYAAIANRLSIDAVFTDRSRKLTGVAQTGTRALHSTDIRAHMGLARASSGSAIALEIVRFKLSYQRGPRRQRIDPDLNLKITEVASIVCRSKTNIKYRVASIGTSFSQIDAVFKSYISNCLCRTENLSKPTRPTFDSKFLPNQSIQESIFRPVRRRNNDLTERLVTST